MALSFDHGFRAVVSLERVYSHAMISYEGSDVMPLLPFSSLFSLVKCSLFLFHKFIEFVEVDVGEYRGDYSALWRTAKRLRSIYSGL